MRNEEMQHLLQHIIMKHGGKKLRASISRIRDGERIV